LKKHLTFGLAALCLMGAGAWTQQRRPERDVEQRNVIDVTASRYRFEPASISVTQGDSVRLRVRSADVSHSLAIKAFRVKTVAPRGGEPVMIEFVADRAGTFEITCSEYCGSGHSGMKGTLVVVAKQ
jgi:heme/copper-type cytochrome/quinol oxidase subunit 2